MPHLNVGGNDELARESLLLDLVQCSAVFAILVECIDLPFAKFRGLG